MIDKKICIIAPVHQYNDVRVFQKQAISLSNDYKSVTLFSRAGEDKVEEGVSIKNVPTFESRVLRFLYLIVLYFRVLFYRSDVYILHNPDTLPLLFGLKLLGRKVIYDTHEDFSKRILMRGWIPGVFRPFLAKCIEYLEKLAYILSDSFIVTQNTLIEKYGNEAFLVENAPVVSNKLLKKVNKNFAKNKLRKVECGIRLVYVGGISVDRGALDVLNGLAVINQSFHCELILIGPLSDDLLNEMKQHNAWKYVFYKGVLPQYEAFSWMKCSDVGLIWLRDVGDYSETSPNKLFEYGAMGIPFIATNFNLWKSKLDSYNSGVFIEPQNIENFVDSVKFLYENPEKRADMGTSGNEFVHGEYNWSCEYKKFKLAIDKALK
jgi:glycosyltransferase involved in cell wall biosynthesis